MPLPIFLRDLMEPNPILRGTVEVRIADDPNFPGSGDKGASQRIYQREVSYIQGSIGAVKLVRPAFAIFRLFKIRQHIGVAPALAAETLPPIVIRGIPANVNHCVDGTGAANYFASWPI